MVPDLPYNFLKSCYLLNQTSYRFKKLSNNVPIFTRKHFFPRYFIARAVVLENNFAAKEIFCLIGH